MTAIRGQKTLEAQRRLEFMDKKGAQLAAALLKEEKTPKSKRGVKGKENGSKS